MNNRNVTNANIAPFVYVTDVELLVKPILYKRLPQSANVYAMAVLSSRFASPTEMAFFTLDVPVEDRHCQTQENCCWIIGAYFREDQGVKYSISAPLDTTIVTDFVQNAFFVCNKGNVATICPTYLYFMDIADSMKIVYQESSENLDTGYELKCLDSCTGVEFFTSTWKYTQKNTEVAVRKILEKIESGGVFVNQKIVCGGNVNGSGLVGMLHTLPECRNKGFATLTMKYLIKKLALQGILPCSAVDMQNEKSKIFHEKLGMKFSHIVDFIRNEP